MRTTSLITVLLVAVALLLPAAPAFAQCSCGSLDANGPEDATVVFTGVVSGESQDEADASVWPFAVEKVDEGSVDGDSVEVMTPASADDCGYEFDVGSRYRVYAVEAGDGAPLETNTCLGTVKVLTTDATEEATEEPTETETATSEPSPDPTPTSTVAADGEELSETGAPLALLVVVGFAAIGLGGALQQRRSG